MATDNGPLSVLIQNFRKAAVDDARVWPLIGLAVLGIVTLVVSAFSTLRVVLSVLLPGKSLRSFGAKKGAWAVVTGSTAGIGEEFARQLARAGFNVVLVSRDPAKLQQQAQELQGKGAQVKTFAIDLANATADDFAGLSALVSSLDVGVLVNNAGVSSPYPEYFIAQAASIDEGIVAVNIDALVRITRIIAPGMASRKRGLILNMGSFSGHISSPLLATYAASKQFVFTFSQALGRELQPYGVVVQAQNTYFVVSNMSKIRKSSLLVPTAKTYVRSVLGHIGRSGGAAGSQPYMANPYPPHAFVQWLTDRFAPLSLSMTVAEYMHIDIRKRALAKAQRNAKKGQ